MMNVAEKKKAGWTIPVPLLEQFKELTAGMHGKEHWTVAAAAVLALLELPPEVRAHYVTEVWRADNPHGSYDVLLEKLKSGELREEAFKHAPPVRGVTINSGGEHPAPRRPGGSGSAGGRRSRQQAE